MKRTGFADLPMHRGRVPHWFTDHMTRLGASMTGGSRLKRPTKDR